MSEIIKQSMSNIWASAGDIVAPDSVKIADGWLVEVVPRQYWNWMQNRTDTNLAYMLQHGIPEWDATTEFIANKSYVQYSDVVYKAILTGTNKIPSSQPTYWKVAFATSTAALEALKATTPAADKLPYFNGTTTATTTTLTSFARTILDDTTQAAMLTTIGAQPVDATLTALAGVTTATNKLPYFTGVDTVATTDLTAFARTILDDLDAASVRVTIGAQPLNAILTALAGQTTAANKLPYFSGVDTATVTDLSAFGRSLIDDADATAARTTIGLNNVNNTSDATKPVSAAQQAALDLKAPLLSPALTGVPTAPTATVGTSTTQIASTAFVNAEIAADRPYSVTTTDIKMDGVQSLGVLATLPRADHVHPSDTSKLSLSGGTMTGYTILSGPQATYNYGTIHDTNGMFNISRFTKAGVWNNSLMAMDFNGVTTFYAGVTATSFTGPLVGNASSATTLSGDQSNWASLRSSAVANMLGWKNYGNGHVIFDASAGTAPNGAAINNSYAGIAWTTGYPTLMGWNGSTTFGVRVDSARVADSCTDSGWITATLVNGFTHNAGSALRYRKVGNIVYVKGTVDHTTPPAINLVITTLPAGFRPSLGETHLELWITNSNFTSSLRTVSVTTAGDISLVFTYDISTVAPSGPGNIAVNTSFPV